MRSTQEQPVLLIEKRPSNFPQVALQEEIPLIGEYGSTGALVALRRAGLFVDAMGVRSMISCDEPKGDHHG